MSHRAVNAGALVVVLLGACVASGQNEPFFSVQNGGPTGLRGDFIFQTVGGEPTIVGGGPGIGMGRTGDELQSMSPVADPDRATKDFIICFSVDPFAVGQTRLRITLQNVFRQAQNRQQAGDAFLTTEAFRRDFGVLPPPFSMGLNNNALSVNQSEDYPNAFGLLPLADPDVQVPIGTPLDEIDASMRATPFTPPRIYFTASGDSPSHPFLPGPDSGATIFFDPDFSEGGAESVYSSPSQLFLQPPDEIDGLIVLDDNLNGAFDGTDTVYFSLTPDSPTLQVLGASPGDVLFASPGALGVFAQAQVLGLLKTDNMTAMNMVPLINDSAQDTINNLVDCPADFNEDGDIDTRDVSTFLNLWVVKDRKADFDGNGDINTRDVLAFLNQWTGGC